MSLRPILFFLVVGGYFAYDYINDADRDDSGNIISEGQIDAFSMRVGDCFNDSQEFFGSGEEIQNVAGLPCSQPHDNEVYAVFDVSLASFPGDEAMFGVATDECLKYFNGFVGETYENSVLDLFAMYPTSESWSRMGDREVVCAVYHIDGEKLTGSVKGRGI